MIRFRLKTLIEDWEFKNGRHLKLKDLAEKTEIHRTTLSRIAGSIGDRSYNTTTDNIDKLCAFFGCEVGDIMEYVPDEKTKVSSRGGEGREVGPPLTAQDDD